MTKASKHARFGKSWRCAIFLTIASAVAASASAASDVITMPELVSRSGGGGGSAWKDVPSLQKAADEGNPQARYQLAELYEVGQYVEQDLARAVQLYQQAAAAGEIDAKLRLASFHHDGMGGLEKDLTKAFEYYREAALAGRGVGQFNVGAMLASGRGVKRDYTEGLAWLILATNNGVDEDGEKRLRERLARRPEMIAAAEKRAVELEAQIDAAQPKERREALVPLHPSAAPRPGKAVPPRPAAPGQTKKAMPKMKAPKPPPIRVPTMRRPGE